MREIFNGDKGQSYPSRAGTLANELNETLADLRTNVIQLRSKNHRQLEDALVGHVGQDFEVLELFYKLYRHVSLSKPFLVKFAMLCLSFYMFLTGDKPPEDAYFWVGSCHHMVCVVAHWTVRGSQICKKLVSSGLLYSYIHDVQLLSCFPELQQVRH